MVDGFGEFIASIEELKAETDEANAGLQEDLDEGVSEAASALRNRMVEEAPVDEDGDHPGFLRDSIEIENTGPAKYEVGPTAEYAEHVEYGTGAHEIMPKGMDRSDIEAAAKKAQSAFDAGEDPTQPMRDLAKEKGALFWTGDEHSPPYFVVQHPGTDAQPFFHKAVAEAEEKDYLVNELDKATDDWFDPHKLGGSSPVDL